MRVQEKKIMKKLWLVIILVVLACLIALSFDGIPAPKTKVIVDVPTETLTFLGHLNG